MNNPQAKITRNIQSTRENCEEYIILEELGNGAEGKVFKGKKKSDSSYVAIKSPNYLAQREKETIEKLMRIKFRNVINYLDLIITNEGSYIVMEFADKGELYKYYNTIEFKKTTQKEKNEMFLQIVNGVAELHNLKWIHRDLKPENVVIKSQGGSLTLCVCDLGLLKEQKPNSQMTMSIGTPYYQAPELLQQNFTENQNFTYTENIDIWALGMMWYELLTGTTMLNANNHIELHKIIKSIDNQQIANIIDSNRLIGEQWIKDIMKNMLDTKEELRWPAKKIAQKISHNLNSDQSQILNEIQPTKSVFQMPQFQKPISQGIIQYGQNPANKNFLVSPLVPPQQPNPSFQINYQQNRWPQSQNFQPSNQNSQGFPKQPQQIQVFGSNTQQLQNPPQIQAVAQKPELQYKGNIDIIGQLASQKQEIKQAADNQIKQELERLKQNSEDLKLQQQLIKERIEQEKREEYERKIQALKQESDKQLQAAIQQKQEEINQIRIKQEEELARYKSDQENYQKMKIEQELQLQTKLNLFKAEQEKQAEDLFKKKEVEINQNLALQYNQILKEKENELKKQLEDEIKSKYNTEYNEKLRKIKEAEEKQKEESFNEKKKNVFHQIDVSDKLLINFCDQLKQKQQENIQSKFVQCEELNQYAQYLNSLAQLYEQQIQNIQQDKLSLNQITYSINSESLQPFSEKYTKFVEELVNSQNFSNQKIASYVQNLQLRTTLQQQQQRADEVNQQQRKQQLQIEIENQRNTFQMTSNKLIKLKKEIEDQLKDKEIVSIELLKYDPSLFQECQKLKSRINLIKESQSKNLAQLQILSDEESTNNTYKQLLIQQQHDEQQLQEIKNDFQNFDFLLIEFQNNIGQQIEQIRTESFEQIDQIQDTCQAMGDFHNLQSIEAQIFLQNIVNKLSQIEDYKLQLNKTFDQSPDQLEIVKTIQNEIRSNIEFINNWLDNLNKLKSQENQIKCLEAKRKEKIREAQQQLIQMEKRRNRAIEDISNLMSHQLIFNQKEELDQKKKELESMQIQAQNEIKLLEFKGEIKTKENLNSFYSEVQSFLQKVEQELVYNEKNVAYLKRVFEENAQKYLSQCDKALNQAKDHFNFLEQNIQKYLRHYEDLKEFKNFLDLKQYESKAEEYDQSVKNLKKKLELAKEEQARLDNFEVKLKTLGNCKTKESLKIINKMQQDLARSKSELELKLNFSKRIEVKRKQSNDINQQIKLLTNEKDALLNFSQKLKEKIQDLEQLKNQVPLQDFEFKVKFFIENSQQIWDQNKQDDLLENWKNYSHLLQEDLLQLILLSKGRLLISFYDLKRYAQRIKAKNQLKKGKNEFSKPQENTKALIEQQEILDFVAQKSYEYEQNIFSNQKQFIDETELLYIFQDQEKAQQFQAAQENIILQKNKVKLRGFIKNQDIIKTASALFKDLEFNQISLLQLIEEQKI